MTLTLGDGLWAGKGEGLGAGGGGEGLVAVGVGEGLAAIEVGEGLGTACSVGLGDGTVLCTMGYCSSAKQRVQTCLSLCLS